MCPELLSLNVPADSGWPKSEVRKGQHRETLNAKVAEHATIVWLHEVSTLDETGVEAADLCTKHQVTSTSGAQELEVRQLISASCSIEVCTVVVSTPSLCFVVSTTSWAPWNNGKLSATTSGLLPNVSEHQTPETSACDPTPRTRARCAHWNRVAGGRKCEPETTEEPRAADLR